MDLKAIHHVGLVVRDLDRSIYFYHDLLGLPFATEPTPWFEGPELAKGLGVPGAAIRLASLWVGEHSTIELLQYRDRADLSGKVVANNHLGSAHVCFKVDDIHAKKSELEKGGVVFFSDVNEIDEGPLTGWSWCYFSDPDGITLELVETAGYLKEEREAGMADYLRTRPSLAEVEAGLGS